MCGRPCGDCGATHKDGHSGWLPTGEMRTCGECSGTRQGLETRYDYLPREILAGIPVTVVRQDRGATFNEQLLGLDRIFSAIDYGRAWATPVVVFTVEVTQKLAETSTQACHVVDHQDRLPSAIAVVVHRDGYSVLALDQERLEHLTRERGYAEGMAVGQVVAAQGGNGTLAGVYR